MARLDTGRILVGLVLITLGVLLGLERSGVIGDFNVWSLWPLVIVAVGVSMLLSDRATRIGGVNLTRVRLHLPGQSLRLLFRHLLGIFA
ncbi:MAG TPA: DUF5668 domain-containing protein, partial [Thermomicrobiales bacterium]|nr:DUF5668 domain-containing protein [Thermomicrobiales bacterium]